MGEMVDGLVQRTIMKMKFSKDQTQNLAEEILEGQDLRNHFENHHQLEEVLSVMAANAVNELVVERLSRPSSCGTLSGTSTPLTETTRISTSSPISGSPSSSRRSVSLKSEKNGEWTPKVSSLKSQRQRLRMRSRSGSPKSRTPDLSSVIDPKYLSRVLVSPPLGIGNMDIVTNSTRVSPTFARGSPTLSSPDSGIGATIRARKSSISEETVSIKPKQIQPIVERRGRKINNLNEMRGKISRSLERKFKESKPPIPMNQIPLVCLSPTVLSPAPLSPTPLSPSQSLVMSPILMTRSPSPILHKRSISPSSGASKMGPLDRPPSPNGKKNSVGRIGTMRSRESSPIRRRTPSPKRDRALVIDKNGRFSVDIPLENTKDLEAEDALTDKNIQTGQERHIIVKIPKAISGHTRSRSDSFDLSKLASLRESTSSKPPTACREETITKKITNNKFITLKTVQLQ